MVTRPHLQHNLSYVIKFCWWDHRQKSGRHKIYFKIPFRKPTVANLAGITKFAIMFIKTAFKDSKKVSKIRNYLSKCNLYSISWHSKNCWTPVKKCWWHPGVSGDLKIFGSYLGNEKLSKFHHCRIWVKSFRKGNLFASYR